MTTENPNADQHTPHLLFVEDDGFIYAEASDQRQADGLSCLRIADPHCDGGPDPGEREANARRLAVCWNACRGIPTEALESGALADLIRLAQCLAVTEEAAWSDNPSYGDLYDWATSTLDAAREELDRLGLPYTPQD